MDNLLKQVGEIIKTKKNNDVFDITSIPEWNAEMDKKLNQLIKQNQICGILPHDFDGQVWQYIATIKSNCAIHVPDKALMDKADFVFSKSKLFQDHKGYSHELKEYCEEISRVINEMIDDQAEFIDFNNSIILSLLGNIGVQLATAFNSQYYRVALGAAPTITKLVDMHFDCVKRLLFNP